jgi:His-Xaa-Ser system radical SAM maturase HxsB
VIPPADLLPAAGASNLDLVPFRFREIGGDVLLTSHFGDWVFVTRSELAEIARGAVSPGSPLHERLASHRFLRSRLDPEEVAARVRQKKRFLDRGPILHVMVVTLRCNETCVYCHASRADMDRVDTDMSKETAEKSVDLALQTTSPSLTIEFQGGEPLVNFPVVKHIIEYAIAKNRAYGKQLEFTMVTNLSLMDEEKLAYLVDNKVQICTSIDGPEPLHNKQRVLASGNAHAVTLKWMERINKAYIDLGLDPTLYHVEALLTTTREALKYPREIVDQYVAVGSRAIFLRPIDPFGFAGRTARVVEYDRAAYRDFYRTAVEHILDLNKKGVQVLERYAAIFLTKILTAEDPNFLDIRSPGGSAIGQIAYSYDGKIYTSDEGRMMAGMGDDSFLIGDVHTSKYRDLMKHPTVRALVLASIREVQPDCVSCTYAPYCGIQPEHNYRSLGSIFGRMRESTLCSVHKGIQDYLFEKLRENDPATVEILRRWTTVRERTHFIQASAAS